MTVASVIGRSRADPRPAGSGRLQRDQVAFGALAEVGLEIARGYEVYLGADNGFELGLETSQPEQAYVRRQVYEQVPVAVGPFLATSDAAKDPQVTPVMDGCCRHQISAPAPDR